MNVEDFSIKPWSAAAAESVHKQRSEQEITEGDRNGSLRAKKVKHDRISASFFLPLCSG